MAPTTFLETLMLICFGIAWPLANVRMLRNRRAEGKGLIFTMIVLTGYIAGAAAKCQHSPGTSLPGVFWLFAFNGLSVAVNLALQWFYGRRRNERVDQRLPC